MTEFKEGDLVWVHAVTGGTFERPAHVAYPAVVCKKTDENGAWLFGSGLDIPAAGKFVSKREKSQPEVVTPLVVALTARGYLTEEEGALVGVPPSWIKFKNSEQEDWWCSQEWHKKNYPQHWPDGPELTHRAIALADVESISRKLDLILKLQRDADANDRLRRAHEELVKLKRAEQALREPPPMPHEPADAEQNRQAAAFLRSEGYVFNASNGMRGQWEKAASQGAFSVGDAVWFVDSESREPRAGKVVAVSASPSLCVEELGNGKQFTAYASELAHRVNDHANQVVPEVKTDGVFKPGDRVWFKKPGAYGLAKGTVHARAAGGYVDVAEEGSAHNYVVAHRCLPNELIRRYSDGVKSEDHKTPAEEASEQKEEDEGLVGNLTDEEARAARIEHVDPRLADDNKPSEAIARLAEDLARQQQHGPHLSVGHQQLNDATRLWLDQTFDAKGRRRG